MLTGAELKQNDQIIGRVMLRPTGRVSIETDRADLKASLKRVLGRDKKFHTPAEGVEFVRAVVHQFSGSYLQAVAIHSKPRAAAAKRETQLHKVADQHVPALSVAVRYAFARGRKALGTGKKPNVDAAVKAVRAALEEVLPKTLRKVMSAGGVAGIELLSRKMRAAELRTAKRDVNPRLTMSFNRSDSRVVDWADRHAAELITGISETTREDLNNAIAEALETGDFDELRDEILAAVGDEARAELIARTETMTAANAGQRLGWEQAVDEGLLSGDERRTWIATGDESTCPICSDLDGTTAKLDGEYPDPGGEGPPAHPRCRCTEGII